MDYGDFIPLIASAALNYDAQRRALNQQQSALAAMRARQMAAQDQAAQVAAAQAAQYDPTQRQAAQAQIQQQLTSQLDQAVSNPQPVTAQGVQIGQTIPEGQGSSDYAAAKAREQAKTLASLHGLASVMGRIGSASQLRQNEGVAMGDAANQIGQIQNNAKNQADIDQIRVNAIQPSLGEMLASSALGAYGKYNVAKNALQPKSAAALYPEYGAASGATGGWV